MSDVQQREKKILDLWERERVFERSVEEREGAPLFSFYDGPPFATGLPHYGHLLAGTIKDAVLRYKTMKGYRVPRVFGWDCHGLPVENEIEKAQQLSGAASIEGFGIAKFNEACRSIVFTYAQQWEETVKKMGRWVEFQGGYRTMDRDYMESVWWVFGQLYQKGLIYEGLKVMPFSTALGTPISNFEANLNYRDVEDPSLTVAFQVKGREDLSLLVWTTTPWTLPSNLALAVQPDSAYVEVTHLSSGRRYLCAKGRLNFLFPQSEEIREERECLGRDLIGLKYEPLFPYFAEARGAGAFHVVADEFVSVEEGTGILHLAPAFGEQDFYVCLREGIEPVCPVDSEGRFTKDVSDFVGVFVKDADKEIIRRLKAEKRVFYHGQIRHRYPFCWRTDTPLIYRVVKTWFVAVEKIKPQILKAADQITWVPGHIKEGRFGKWLENARDWAVSRNRYWGTPIPLWRAEDGSCIVVESVADLERRSGVKAEDLHRHFIDEITFVEDGKTYRRIPEVFDCWFESGSMPYAQMHYPFENRERFEKSFPADFIGEGLDQTRGWFYTLTVLAAALFEKPAFRNVIVNGLVLAEDGNKMSKRLRNYPDPMVMIERYGADAVRLYMLNSPVVRGEDLRFTERGVEQVVRGMLLPLSNAQQFLSTYTTIYHWKPGGSAARVLADLDRWILSLLQKTVAQVDQAMERYQLDEAAAPVVAFIDQLTNWYIRRSRGRFWADEATPDREAAFSTLHHVLETVAKLLAPLAPFQAEELYQAMKGEQSPLSVHLCDFPKLDEKLVDQPLQYEMELVQSAVSLGHALRKESKMRVRQPLLTARVACAAEGGVEALTKHLGLIADELNVKQVVLESDEAGFVSWQVKPEFRLLGKRVGQLMPQLKAAVEELKGESIERLKRGESIELQLEGEPFALHPHEVKLERKVLPGLVALADGRVAVALDLTLTPELEEEGLVREFISKINSMRREGDFAVTDRIRLRIDAPQAVLDLFEKYRTHICHETLIREVEIGSCVGSSWELGDHPLVLAVEVV